MADSYAQIYTFILYSAFIGFVLGFVYDFFRIIRLAFYMSGKRITAAIVYFICDILFFLVSAVVCAIFIFYVNNGSIRGIALFASLIGFVIYYNTVGRLVGYISEAVIKAVYSTLGFILTKIMQPVWHFLVGIGDSIYTYRQTARRIKSFKRKGC